MAARIFRGEYGEYGAMPAMAAIAKEMGMGHRPVRKAYQELWHAGLIRRQGRKFCVSQETPGSGPPLLYEMLTVAEVAAALRVSRETVYRMIDNEEVETIRAGKQYRILRRSIHDLIERSRRGASRGTIPQATDIGAAGT